jgi:hypothetical protein
MDRRIEGQTDSMIYKTLDADLHHEMPYSFTPEPMQSSTNPTVFPKETYFYAYEIEWDVKVFIAQYVR